MENRVGIEYKPKIKCEPSHEEEIECLFDQLEEILEEDEEKQKDAKATEEAKWLKQDEELQALLKKEGQTEEEVSKEIEEILFNVFKEKKD